jgi:hypothetical protein
MYRIIKHRQALGHATIDATIKYKIHRSDQIGPSRSQKRLMFAQWDVLALGTYQQPLPPGSLCSFALGLACLT